MQMDEVDCGVVFATERVFPGKPEGKMHCDARLWTGFMRIRTESTSCCENGGDPLGSIKGGEFFN
jgi:hypothetical protein